MAPNRGAQHAQFPKGSEWRKWDLHIHSDASDGRMSCREIVDRASAEGLSVIALTDHHTSRNIDLIRDLGQKAHLCALGGVEFRTEYGDKSVHMTAIFPETFGDYVLNSRNLEDLVLNPLGLSEAKIVAAGRKKLINKGTKAPSDELSFREGVFLVQVGFKEAANMVHKYGGLVVVHAGSKANSVDEEMKHIGKPGVTLANCLGPVKDELFREGYIDICEIRKENDDESFYLSEFRKPSIVASDAHEPKEIGTRFCWIKADPCFSGLRYLVNEPASRVLLSEKPELFDRVAQNGTKYIETLTLDAAEGYDGRNGKWFSKISIPFGKELSVAIGNKGSGKSAITDTLGLCANSRHSQYFSFLRAERFLEHGYAENFRARLSWASGVDTGWKALNESVENTRPDSVQYLPQGYFEQICNDIGSLEEFKSEINSVVFQHIPGEDRHGMETFSDFFESKKSSILRIVSSKKQTLHELNASIAQLESMRNPTYREEVANKKLKKQAEIDALPKPTKVAPPKSKAQKGPASADQLAQMKVLTKEIAGLKREIVGARSRIQRNNNISEVLRQFQRELMQKKDELDQFVDSFESRLKGVRGLDIRRILSYKVDLAPIKALTEDLKKKLGADRDLVNERSVKDPAGAETSLVVRLADMENRQKKLQSKLDEPSRQYEAFKKAQKQWKERVDRIRGTSSTPETLKYYEAREKYIEKSLDKEIADKRKERSGIVSDIFRVKSEMIDIYTQVKQYIDNVITTKQDQLGDYRIGIVAEYALSNDIVPTLLGRISKNVVGSYYGTESAEKALASIVEKLDPNKVDSVIKFLDRVVLSLERDERSDTLEPRYIDNQVEDPVAFYDYLFSLDYLLENYELRLGNKKLEKLSPGEKGALLVVFYLLLDKSDKPLVLDQPEDNLDNESVSQILVPFIKEAKRRRQIIMVTHNPNLAVYADAEQVIRTRIDKERGNVFSCSLGGIDNLTIKQQIVNVLEGTMPAFENRSSKYKATGGA